MLADHRILEQDVRIGQREFAEVTEDPRLTFVLGRCPLNGGALAKRQTTRMETVTRTSVTAPIWLFSNRSPEVQRRALIQGRDPGEERYTTN